MDICIKTAQVITLFLAGVEMTVQMNTLLSYNTGLANDYPKYKKRIAPMIETLKQEKSDLICLQEVWNGVDVNKIIRAVSPSYKYSFSSLHQRDGTVKKGAACERSDRRFLGCLMENKCHEIKNYPRAISCLVNKCNVMNLKQNCITCILSSEPRISSIYKDCFKAKYDFNTNGLLLLSKRTVKRATVEYYVPNVKQLKPRGYLQAKVDGIGNVICTQLTPDLFPGYVEKTLQYGSWREQNYAEVQKLLKISSRKKNAIIMGTLNTGPAVPHKSVTEELPDSYRELMASGFRSGYVDLVGKCTRCTSNPFNIDDLPYSTLTNHILTKGCKAKSARRRFTKIITGRDYPLSYLYGVEITF